MTHRPATLEDIPAIVQLLKASLGEVSSPKTEAYWRWKHVDNPFGPSPVWVAEEAGQLIGVRAFMRWAWHYKGTTYAALRAVDTATHPQHQGRGIFKKLTLGLIEECRQQGHQFIFNTPNTQSMPGYLKMGWQALGKVPVRVKPVAPLGMIAHRFFGKKVEMKSVPTSDKEWGGICREMESHLRQYYSLQSTRYMVPHLPEGFVRWRYADCPVQAYFSCIGPGFGFVYYPKSQRMGVELRISELWIQEGATPREFREALRHRVAATGAAYVSATAYPDAPTAHMLSRAGFWKPLPLGPALTFRPIQDNLPSEMLHLPNWLPVMGSLELF